jgi:hypothetical protein
MTIRDRQQAYELSGGAKGAVALDDQGIERRVEGQWHSCRLPQGALKQLVQRSDAAGLRNFAPWILLLAGSGALAFFACGSWWAIPAFFVYGTLYTSSVPIGMNAPMARPSATASSTRPSMSDLLRCLREAFLWRWAMRAITETMMVGRDRRSPCRGGNLPAIAADFLYLSGFVELRKIFLHAAGIMTPGREFVPETSVGR